MISAKKVALATAAIFGIGTSAQAVTIEFEFQETITRQFLNSGPPTIFSEPSFGPGSIVDINVNFDSSTLLGTLTVTSAAGLSVSDDVDGFFGIAPNGSEGTISVLTFDHFPDVDEFTFESVVLIENSTSSNSTLQGFISSIQTGGDTFIGGFGVRHYQGQVYGANSLGNINVIQNFPQATVVPLPASAWLLLASFGGLAAFGRRKLAA